MRPHFPPYAREHLGLLRQVGRNSIPISSKEKGFKGLAALAAVSLCKFCFDYTRFDTAKADSYTPPHPYPAPPLTLFHLLVQETSAINVDFAEDFTGEREEIDKRVNVHTTQKCPPDTIICGCIEFLSTPSSIQL